MVIFQQHDMYEVGMGLAILLCLIFGLAARRFNWILPVRQMNLLADSRRILRREHVTNLRKFSRRKDSK